jgi:hypothetical protein
VQELCAKFAPTVMENIVAMAKLLVALPPADCSMRFRKSLKALNSTLLGACAINPKVSTSNGTHLHISSIQFQPRFAA